MPPVAARLAGNKNTPDPIILPATMKMAGITPTVRVSDIKIPFEKGNRISQRSADLLGVYLTVAMRELIGILLLSKPGS